MVENTAEPLNLSSAEQFKNTFRQEKPTLYVAGQIAEKKVSNGRNVVKQYQKSHDDALLFKQIDKTGQEVEQPFGEKEFQHLRKLLLEVTPVTVFNYQDWMNANMASHMARELAAQVGINPDRAAAVTLLQNLLKTVGGSQYNRSFLVARQIITQNNPKNIAEYNGLRSDLVENLIEPSTFSSHIPRLENESDEAYEIRKTKTINEKIASMPLERKVVMMATILGKRQFNKETGVAEGVVPLEESIEKTTHELRYDNLMTQLEKKANPESFQFQSLDQAKMYETWPSEKKYNAEVPAVAAMYYKTIATELKQRGIDLTALQHHIAEQERGSSEKVVVFDLGGLAQESPELVPMIAPLARMFGQDEKTFAERWDKHYGEHHYDFSSADEFSQKMVKIFAGENVSLTPDQIQIIRNVYLKSINPNMDQSMVDVLSKLRENHKGMQIVAFTNTTPDHAEINKDTLYTFFDQVVRSDITHGSKGNRRDFMLLCALFDLPVNSFIFLDDNKGNVDRANEIGIHAIHMNKFGNMDEFLPKIEEYI